MKYKLLLVDDDEVSLFAMRTLLEKHGYLVDCAQSGEQGIAKLSADPNSYAVVVLDFRMQGKDGANTAEEMLSINREIYILIHSGDTSQDAAVSSWRAGAVTFIPKSLNPDFFLRSVKEWYEKFLLNFDSVSPDPSDAEKLIRTVGMIGRSKALADLAVTITSPQVRESTSSVLILGENGSGKELVAKAIHNASSRASKPFVDVNCAALPENLIERELFGNERGAFTGADSKKIGLFEAANGGTLFLDEIGEASLSLQAKLLRVLQEKKIRPLGSTKDIDVDVRIIAATNRDLDHAIAERLFRQDLYYRVGVLVFDIPPLRERPEDIEPLLRHFAEIYNRKKSRKKTFLSKTAQLLEAYPWPGNIRELENVASKLLVFSPSDKIGPSELDPKYLNKPQELGLTSSLHRDKVDSVTKEMIVSSLSSANSMREAARRVGIPFTSFRRLVRKYGIDVSNKQGAL